MKKGFQFLLTLALLILVLAMPAFGQEEGTLEAVATQEVLAVAPVPDVGEAPVVEPVAVVDTETSWIDGSPLVWGGWAFAVFFAAAFFFAVKELAKSGNEKAEYGLKFFEAARDMLPIDKWQQQFEAKASESITPADDLLAVVTRVVLEQIGAVKNKTDDSQTEINVSVT